MIDKLLSRVDVADVRNQLQDLRSSCLEHFRQKAIHAHCNWRLRLVDIGWSHCESAMFVSVLPRPGTVLAAVASVAGADLGVPEDRAKSEIAAARTAAALFSDVNFAIKACTAGTAEFVGASRRNEFNASIALSVSPEPAHASPIMISAPFAAPFPYCTAVCASARASSNFDCLRYVLASAQWASQFSASIEMAFCRIDAAEGRSPC